MEEVSENGEFALYGAHIIGHISMNAMVKSIHNEGQA